MSKTEKCERCGKRFKVLERELCYHCYLLVHKNVPTTGCYKMEKKQK